MAKDYGTKRNIFVGLWGTELKLLLAAVLFLCSILTYFQLFPSGISFSVSDFHRCLAATTTTTTYSNVPVPANPAVLVREEIITTTTPPTNRQAVAHDEVLGGGLIIKRTFQPHGIAAYSYIFMSAYRGGLNTFAIVGMSSKPLQVFGNPSYECEWVPRDQQQPHIKALGFAIRPEFNFGNVYSVVVVNCTFPVPVVDDPSGGTLLMHASTNGGGDTKFNLTDTIEALTEAPGSLSLAQVTARPKYDYLYCGSPLFGVVSPQRLREWLAYHIKLLGPKSHFVLRDAGGLSPEAMKVLGPWMEKGYITLEDIKENLRFDGPYHNQLVVLNDCLFRYRFMAEWIFFFDVDEFLYLPNNASLASLMDSLSNYTHFTYEQMPMSDKLCHSNNDINEMNSKWEIEKLVYRDTKLGVHYQLDRKYAARPTSIFAAGIHRSGYTSGMITDDTGGRLMYFHYHNSISQREDSCQQLINATETEIDGVSYVLDTRVQETAESVKRFELEMIGPVLQSTPL